jgi:hypothetical protein
LEATGAVAEEAEALAWGHFEETGDRFWWAEVGVWARGAIAVAVESFAIAVWGAVAAVIGAAVIGAAAVTPAVVSVVAAAVVAVVAIIAIAAAIEAVEGIEGVRTWSVWGSVCSGGGRELGLAFEVALLFDEFEFFLPLFPAFEFGETAVLGVGAVRIGVLGLLLGGLRGVLGGRGVGSRERGWSWFRGRGRWGLGSWFRGWGRGRSGLAAGTGWGSWFRGDWRGGFRGRLADGFGCFLEGKEIGFRGWGGFRGGFASGGFFARGRGGGFRGSGRRG